MSIMQPDHDLKLLYDGQLIESNQGRYAYGIFLNERLSSDSTSQLYQETSGLNSQLYFFVQIGIKLSNTTKTPKMP